MAQVGRNGGTVSGPIKTTRVVNGQKVEGRSSSVTVTALAAAAEETYTIADTDAEVGMVVSASPNVAPEAGWGIICAWVDAAGSIKIKVSNFGAAGLTGGALVINYTLTK
jgi:hypothetical protein